VRTEQETDQMGGCRAKKGREVRQNARLGRVGALSQRKGDGGGVVGGDLLPRTPRTMEQRGEKGGGKSEKRTKGFAQWPWICR